MAFIIWSIVGVIFMGLGIFSFLAKKAVGFWANAETLEVNDVKGYNRAVGKLWCAFGVVFILLGIPLLGGQNSPFIVITMLGVVVEVITVMIVYTLVIEKKYHK